MAATSSSATGPGRRTRPPLAPMPAPNCAEAFAMRWHAPPGSAARSSARTTRSSWMPRRWPVARRRPFMPVDDQRLASSLGADVARVTHQAPLLVDACRLFTCMISAALAGRSREQVLAVAEEMTGMPLKDEVLELADGLAPAAGSPQRQPAGILRVPGPVVREFSRDDGFQVGLSRPDCQAVRRPGRGLRGLRGAGRGQVGEEAIAPACGPWWPGARNWKPSRNGCIAGDHWSRALKWRPAMPARTPITSRNGVRQSLPWTRSFRR